MKRLDQHFKVLWLQIIFGDEAIGSVPERDLTLFQTIMNCEDDHGNPGIFRFYLSGELKTVLSPRNSMPVKTNCGRVVSAFRKASAPSPLPE